jgi:hypothetical protein
MNVLYVRIRSFHVVREQQDLRWKTRCGRLSGHVPVDVLPGNVKTCEACAVSLVRAVDRGEG